MRQWTVGWCFAALTPVTSQLRGSYTPRERLTQRWKNSWSTVDTTGVSQLELLRQPFVCIPSSRRKGICTAQFLTSSFFLFSARCLSGTASLDGLKA